MLPGGESYDALSRPALPMRVRLLLALTTRPWKSNGALSPWFNARVDELVRRGWMVRSAPWRNHLLWQNGTTIRDGRVALIVLPVGSRLQSAAEYELLLATEIVEAEMRALHWNPGPKEKWDRLAPFVGMIGAFHGIRFVDVERHLLRIRHRLGTN